MTKPREGIFSKLALSLIEQALQDLKASPAKERRSTMDNQPESSSAVLKVMPQTTSIARDPAIILAVEKDHLSKEPVTVAVPKIQGSEKSVKESMQFVFTPINKAKTSRVKPVLSADIETREIMVGNGEAGVAGNRVHSPVKITSVQEKMTALHVQEENHPEEASKQLRLEP